MKSGVLLLILLAVSTGFAGTLQVDSGSNYSIPRTGVSWGDAGLPVQPTFALKFGDGMVKDTLNGRYREYGSVLTAGGFADGANGPYLTEGNLSAGQSAGSFGGSRSIVAGDVSDLDVTTGSMSVAMWCRPTAATRGAYFTKSSDANATSAGWGIGYYESMDTPMGYVCMSSSDYISLSGTSATGRNKWHLLGLAFDATAKSCSLFVDGVYAADGLDADITTLTTNARATIGRGGSGSTRYATGDVSWVGFWDGTTVRSGEWLALFGAMTPTGSNEKPFPTISSAIAHAENRSAMTILVSEGIYSETLTISVDSLTIRAASIAYRPMLSGYGLTALSGFDAITVTARTTLQYLNISGYSTGRGIVDTTDYGGGSRFIRMVMDSCRGGLRGNTNSDFETYNLTIDNAGLSGSTGVKLVGSGTATISNCIIVNADSGFSIGDDFTVTGSANNLWNVPANHGEFSGFYFNPLFRDIVGNDYKLQAGSRLIDRGVGYVGAEYSGRAPDIGAFETRQRQNGGILIPEKWSRGKWGRQ